MKQLFAISAVAVFTVMVISCGRKNNSGTTAPDFGIYHVLTADELPAGFPDTLEEMNVVMPKESSGPFVGYVTEKSMPAAETALTANEAKLVTTYRTVDDSGRYFGLLAITLNAGMVGSDIFRTVPQGNNVEIRFTGKGAKKWARMTAENTGGFVAFVIDGEAYSTPAVKAEIRSGTAIISALDNEDVAAELSAKLNGK